MLKSASQHFAWAVGRRILTFWSLVPKQELLYSVSFVFDVYFDYSILLVHFMTRNMANCAIWKLVNSSASINLVWFLIKAFCCTFVRAYPFSNSFWFTVFSCSLLSVQSFDIVRMIKYWHVDWSGLGWQDSFQRLLHKRDGKRAEWEYPFAVAGINISFMLAQMLDLQTGNWNFKIKGYLMVFLLNCLMLCLPFLP